MLKNYFEKRKLSIDNFKKVIKEKDLENLVSTFHAETNSELANVLYELNENEKVIQVDLDKMGGQFSTFVKIANGENERFYHCGSSFTKEKEKTKYDEIKTFFKALDTL